MSESTIWWLLAGMAVAVELVTGTFYLLMLALGLAAGAIAAYLGFTPVVQLLTAALIGGGAVLSWHFVRSRQPAPLHANANRDVNLDIGEAVQVDQWNADGTATVKFRGASWTAVLADYGNVSHDGSESGRYRIREMMGNRLVIEKA
jgi:membrane protein implicated in regulation of membrane protease activity